MLSGSPLSESILLFAPRLLGLDAARAVCTSVSKPANFLIGILGRSFTVAELKAADVKRISLATSLCRAAMSDLIDAAREVMEHGTFVFLDGVLAGIEQTYADLTD